MVLLNGVLNLGCKVPNIFCGNNPSLAIPKKMRVCANIITNITDIKPAVAAIVIKYTAQSIPATENAEATGAFKSSWP